MVPPRWALVRVRLAGICNTDLEILRGYHDFEVRQDMNSWARWWKSAALLSGNECAG